MGVPLPKDTFFNNLINKYNKNGYDKICREFGILPGTDFRFTAYENDGLGRVYKDMFGVIHDVTKAYNEKMKGLFTNKWPGGFFYFKDESGSWGNHELDHISPLREKPYQYFMLNESKGLTKAGLSRLNQSIEAFVYCILGSQVNTRSTIIGNSGSAQETQTVFLQLFESSVIESDISKSIQRYQLATQEAKQKLNLAVAVGCWLLPSNIIINTTSVIGYNNKLLKADTSMSFGVNDINNETKVVVTKNPMIPSKVKKQEIPHEKLIKEEKRKRSSGPPKVPTNTNEIHENKLIAITVATSGLAWYFFR
jgi:hypothetical protein